MAVEVEIDVQVLKSEIKKTYASVSQEPEKDFIFPTGRAWAEAAPNQGATFYFTLSPSGQAIAGPLQ